MQWVFLVLAVLAALVELHTGTFYLAAVAAAALLTTLIGFWIRGDLLILVFVVLCAVLLVAVMLVGGIGRAPRVLRISTSARACRCEVSPQGNRLMVSYRGTNWEAVMDDGSVPAPGGTAIIKRKTDKLLHLAVPVDGCKQKQ